MTKNSFRVKIFRTAMCGGGLSYDVLVPIADILNYDGVRYTTIWREEGKYISYTDATMPEEHYAMDKGWRRYEAYLAHEKQARKTMLTLARQAFPELNQYQGETLPSLWVTGLMDKETHAAKTLTFSRPSWDFIDTSHD